MAEKIPKIRRVEMIAVRSLDDPNISVIAPILFHPALPPNEGVLMAWPNSTTNTMIPKPMATEAQSCPINSLPRLWTLLTSSLIINVLISGLDGRSLIAICLRKY